MSIINKVNFLKRYKNRGLFVLSIVSCFVLVFLIPITYPLFKFILIIPISVLLGFGFVAFLREVLPIRNLFTYLLHCAFWGIFLNSLTIFFIGTLGVSLGFEFFAYYAIILFFFNLLLFSTKMKEEVIANYIKETKFTIVDILWLFLFLLLGFLFIKAGLENYYPNWDSFTHWAIDAKYIFENQVFRDGLYDVISKGYLPFYSLQLNYIYLLYNRVVEQYSSFITLFYGFLGLFTVSSYVLDVRKDNAKKTILYLSLFAGIYSFYIIQNVILTQYADVFIAVLILFYAIVLFYKGVVIDAYWKRFLLIILLAVSVYFTKSHYFVISFFLLLFYFVHDAPLFFKNFNKILKSWKLYLTVIVLGVFLFAINRYSLNFVSEGNVLTDVFLGLELFIKKRILFLFNIIAFIFSEISLFSTTFIILFVFWFTSKKEILRDETMRIVFLVILTIFPVLFYLLTFWRLEDMSILRYLGLIFFLTPYVFTISLPIVKNEKFLKNVFFIGTTFFVAVIVFLKISSETKFHKEFTPHTGEYRDFYWHQEYYNTALKVKEILSGESRVMLVGDDNGNIGNTELPVIILRYYLSDYSTGGQYKVNKDKWENYLLEISPEYILVFDYNDFWEECNDYLVEGSTNLIMLDFEKVINDENNCFFDTEDIIF